MKGAFMTFEFRETPMNGDSFPRNGNKGSGDEAVSGGCLPDLVCFSHLRWDFIFQRPQHLLTRFGRRRRVFYMEEPLRMDAGESFMHTSIRSDGVMLWTPHIPAGFTPEEAVRAQRDLLDAALSRWKISRFVAWYYTPMALYFTSHLKPALTVFDCMDELSAFAGAPPALPEMERKLLSRADLVFTGGVSLYEAKRDRHRNVHAFPSSIDKDHFLHAREGSPEPDDQKGIGKPRIGYHGVIDERMDLDLLAQIADLKADWHWILVGPVCKIDPASLPMRPNIHYLGRKDYAELPRYLGKWQAAMMPFAHNASTRFISPTKTPEYLAAGRPVVSTSIRDVVDPYGRSGLVQIADTPADFVAKCALAMAQAKDRIWRAEVDRFLSGISWDRTWNSMNDLIVAAIGAKTAQGRAIHV
jgi:glycosyltransferase involved in cell wall biosynthesis